MIVYKFRLFDLFLYVLITLLTLSFLYPIAHMIAMSISDPIELGFKTIGIMPVGFSVDAYTFILNDHRIMRYYFNTILYAVTGVPLVSFIPLTILVILANRRQRRLEAEAELRTMNSG